MSGDTAAVSQSIKGGTIIATALSLYLAALAVQKLGSMDLGTLAKGTIVAGLLMRFIGQMQSMPSTATPINTGPMLASAVALLAIGKTMQMLAEIPWPSLLLAVVAINAVLGGLSAAMESIDDDIMGGASLALAAAGILILAKSMQTIGNMNAKSIAVALVTMAADLTIVIVAGKAAMAGAEGLMVLAIALAGLGLVVVAFGVTMTALAGLLTVIAAVGAPAFAVLAGSRLREAFLLIHR